MLLLLLLESNPPPPLPTTTGKLNPRCNPSMSTYPCVSNAYRPNLVVDSNLFACTAVGTPFGPHILGKYLNATNVALAPSTRLFPSTYQKNKNTNGSQLFGTRASPPNIVVCASGLFVLLFLAIFPTHIAYVADKTPGPEMFNGESKCPFPPENGAKTTENTNVQQFMHTRVNSICQKHRNEPKLRSKSDINR